MNKNCLHRDLRERLTVEQAAEQADALRSAIEKDRKAARKIDDNFLWGVVVLIVATLAWVLFRDGWFE